MASRKDYPEPSARTPGPWQYRAGRSGVQIVSPDGIVVARTPCSDRQAMADGALLAAAPRLLDALVALIDSLSGYARNSETADEARAAIAAARYQP